MDDALIDMTREALLTALVLCSPILLIGLLVGMVTSVLQAMTQVHDQSLSFAPKLLVMLAAFSALLPWVMQNLTDYASHLFSTSIW
ncbi:MAG: flagellar biosynthetic protein FliQ [Planctomycetales bacterium]|nr:flagellar biosynthetic protein FliQ [Planctomycetales bacterium]MCA9167317.1 flagellar biosynthetic protein FliQ [Planctomycetales bacterium]